MALDRVNNRVLIPAYGNGGFRAFQLDDEGLPQDRRARFVTSRQSLIGRRSAPLPSAQEATFPGAAGLFDSSTERFFAIDRFPNRILVYDSSRDRLRDFPAAEIVIGQPDFTSTRRGIGPSRMAAVGGGDIDESGQRLFVTDGPNNRVLVFDVRPEELTTEPRAIAVIGQDDFESRDGGTGPSRLNRPGSVAYDPVFERLFVSDAGNNRVLIFDANPGNPDGLKAAIAVMGQPDFESNAPRSSLDELEAESIAYDSVNHRLFIAEDLEHRVMVYDAHPDRAGGPAKAIAVIGQPDAFSTQPAVSQTRVAMPRITVDSVTQKLYVSEGYPAGNRIAIFDISPDKLATGMPATDVIGHESPDGAPDFDNRMAQGRLDGRSLAAARDLELDTVDHRLFVADEYNHRVVVWQLDDLNRIQERDARWVLGQPDLNTSLMGAPTARNMTVPIAAAYDTATKRVFVGDGYNNRILVYDAAPGELASGMAAAIVIGQPDFETVERSAGRDGINFGVRMGRGIASDFLPMGFAVDEDAQRLFVSDSENNRILIYDVRRDILRSGAAAIGVIGQPDFDSTAPRTGALGFRDPGHLEYDAENERLFVIDGGRRRVIAFDVDPQNFTDGQAAIAVLGRPGFETEADGPRAGALAPPLGGIPQISGARFVAPNGIAHDPVSQLLYIADGGGTFGVPADRILAFDVDPARIANGAEAIATLGAPDASTPAARSWGGAEPIPGQFRVRDTRGIDIDPVNGRLFATGSFESRVVMFNFPRASWDYRIGSQSSMSFATLDAADLGGQADAETISVAALNASAAASPSAMIMYSTTRQTVDQASERHSRRLINEAAVAAGAPARRATVFVDGASGRTHRVAIYNPGARAARLTMTLRDARGLVAQQWSESVPSHQQRVIVVEDDAIVSEDATLAIDANVRVAFTALRVTSNSRDEDIIVPAPLALNDELTGRGLVPYFVSGGGRSSELVLINPTNRRLRGTVEFHDSDGRRRPLGTDSDIVNYQLEPFSSRVIASNAAGPLGYRGYATINPSDGGARPAAAVLIDQTYGGVMTSQSIAAGTVEGTAQFAVDLRPSLIRHGQIDTELVVVNPGSESAEISVSVGQAVLFTREIASGRQIVLSVRELAGEDVQGLVTVSSDTPLGISARQRTLNIRAEQIEVELPALASGKLFPYVANGGGISSEIRLSNSTTRNVDGAVAFFTPAGEPATATILR